MPWAGRAGRGEARRPLLALWARPPPAASPRRYGEALRRRRAVARPTRACGTALRPLTGAGVRAEGWQPPAVAWRDGEGAARRLPFGVGVFGPRAPHRDLPPARGAVAHRSVPSWGPPRTHSPLSWEGSRGFGIFFFLSVWIIIVIICGLTGVIPPSSSFLPALPPILHNSPAVPSSLHFALARWSVA